MVVWGGVPQQRVGAFFNFLLGILVTYSAWTSLSFLPLSLPDDTLELLCDHLNLLVRIPTSIITFALPNSPHHDFTFEIFNNRWTYPWVHMRQGCPVKPTASGGGIHTSMT